MIWYLTSFIFTSAFSGTLLTFLVFDKSYKIIDSIKDLADSPLNVVVFEGENAAEYFNDSFNIYHDTFKNRITASFIENSLQEEWEHALFTKVNEGNTTLVSDQVYLDYQFATKLYNYTYLYRS